MADEQAKNGTPTDPMDLWREMRDASMNAWSKAMIETVNTDTYAQASGAVLDTWLTNSAPFRIAFEKTMLKALEQCSMPSRNDFISLADRLTNVETRLDDMDAKLDLIGPAVAKTGDVVQEQVEARLENMEAKLDHIEHAVSKAGSVAQKNVEKQLADMDAKLSRIEQAVANAMNVPQKQAERARPKKQKKGDL